MSVTAPRRGLVSTERYRSVVARHAEGVAVVTSAIGEDTFGTAASAVASLSVDPPMILVGIEREGATGRAIDRSGAFVVNFLADDQSDLAALFFRPGPSGSTTPVDDADEPIEAGGQALLEGCLARIECQVTERVTSATHLVFIGIAQSVDAAAGSPLTAYGGRFHRLDPIEQEV